MANVETKAEVKGFEVSESGFEAAVKAVLTASVSPEDRDVNVNPFEDRRPGETGKTAKARLTLARRFETAREAEVASRRKKIGTAGFNGRFASIFEALKGFAALNPKPDAPLTLKVITALSETAYRAANVERKISKDGAAVYSAYTLNVLTAFEMVAYDAKAEVYILTAAARKILSSPKK